MRLSSWTSANPASTATSRESAGGSAARHPGQQLLEGRDRAGRIARALLRLRQEQRHLEVVGVRARVVAQLADLRVHAAAPLAHEQAQQPHPRLAPERGVLFVARQLAVRQRQHRVPFGDRLVDLLLVFEDLGQQAVGLDVLRLERLAAFRLRDRVGGQVVLEQHLGQPQMAAHRRPHALAQRRPGRARLVLLADLELRFAEADDDDLVPGVELVQPLPRLERASILARPRGQRRQLLQRAPASAEAGDGAIERGGGLRAVPVPHLTLDEIDGELGIVRQPPHQLFERGGGILFVAQLVVERDDAAADFDVARSGRQRGTRRRERAFQIALRVAHPSQHVPLHGPRRAFQLARQLGQCAAAARHRERDRPDGAPALGIGRRKLANQRGERGGRAGAVPRIAASEAQARRAQHEVELRGRVSGANPCLQDLGGGGGRAGALQRVRQADGDLVALRFDARQLAQQHDGLVQGALVGRVRGTGQDRERRVDQAAARGRALFELQRVVVRRQRGSVVAGVGERAGAAGEGGHRLRGDPQDLFERRGRRLGLTQRREQMRIRGERRIGGAAAVAAARSARARNRSRRRALPSRPASLTSRRATSSSSGRSSSARSARSSSAVESVRWTSQSARAGVAAIGTSKAATSARRRTPER